MIKTFISILILVNKRLKVRGMLGSSKIAKIMFVGLLIPTDPAGLVLSFLEDKAAIFYILLYKKANQGVTFIPEDYTIKLTTDRQTCLLGKYSDVENIELGPGCLPLFLDSFKNLKRLRCYVNVKSLENILHNFPKLKELNTSLDYYSANYISIHLTSLNSIEKYKGLLSPENGFSFNLVEFEGGLMHKGTVSLTKYFDPTKLKKFIVPDYNYSLITGLELFTNLEELKIRKNSLTPTVLAGMKNLTNLSVSDYFLDETIFDLSLLSNLPSLRVLTIESKVRLGEIPPVKMLSNLESFTISARGDDTTVDEFGEILSLMTNLKHYKCHNLYSSWLKCLPTCLVSLTIISYIEINTNDRLKGITRLTKLESLTIGGIYDHMLLIWLDLDEIVKLPKIKYLNLKIQITKEVLLDLKKLNLNKMCLNHIIMYNPDRNLNLLLEKYKDGDLPASFLR